MKNLIEELFDYTAKDRNNKYIEYHRDLTSPYAEKTNEEYSEDTSELLKSFLFSKIDEVRLKTGEEYVTRILRKIDIDDAAHFRKGVLMRETGNNIDYDAQRDHSCHTLHNYIMGWYILEKNDLIRKVLFDAMCDRLGKADTSLLWQRFGNIWPFTSLLHDVGYLLEGFIEPLDINIQKRVIKHGAAVIKEYFHRKFWLINGIGAIDERERMRIITGVKEPEFQDESMSSLADTLRNLGSLENIRKRLVQQYHERDLVPPNNINDVEGLFGDAFRLWADHYSVFDTTGSMVSRISELEESFYSLFWDGMKDKGIKMMDHGVCSGLILLLFSTYYFRMYFSIDTLPTHPLDIKIWKKFSEDNVPGNVSYRLFWWWTFIVWATASTAIHNFQQQSRPWRKKGVDTKQLELKQDPLAYLGILVDIVQEWDRHTITRKSSIVGHLPIQSHEVLLATIGNKIEITYPEKDQAIRIRKALDQSLYLWDEIVIIKP